MIQHQPICTGFRTMVVVLRIRCLVVDITRFPDSRCMENRTFSVARIHATVGHVHTKVHTKLQMVVHDVFHSPTVLHSRAVLHSQAVIHSQAVLHSQAELHSQVDPHMTAHIRHSPVDLHRTARVLRNLALHNHTWEAEWLAVLFLLPQIQQQLTVTLKHKAFSHRCGL